ncbi:hypothetical protein EJB05_46915, partial [Eragrostis curvula]
MASSVTASGEPPVLLIRRMDASFSFRVLDFFASGETFLAAAVPEPPRAAGAVRVDAAFLDAVPSLRCRRQLREATSFQLGGIIGLGNIGSLIAKRLEAFGCVINYNSRRTKDSVSYNYFPNVHDLASESDVLIVACALNKETWHVVNKDVLVALGVIINIGRGANIDEAELVNALKEGRIAGAALDVFENEPKVPAELLTMDNVVLSPHVAVFTTESRSDLRDHTIGNLEAFFSGKPLLTPVLP